MPTATSESTGDSSLAAVPDLERHTPAVSAAPGGFALGAEQRVPIEGFVDDGAGYRHWDIMPDGERFLMVFPVDQTDTRTRSQINIVTNWFEELKERVPVP